MVRISHSIGRVVIPHRSFVSRLRVRSSWLTTCRGHRLAPLAEVCLRNPEGFAAPLLHPALSPMSSSGQPFTYSVLVPAPPTGVMQSLLSLPAGGNYFDGYEVRQVTWNSLHVTRRYVPMWAIVVAIAGTIFFLIGDNFPMPLASMIQGADEVRY